MLCAKFGWNWPSGSREEDENVKSLQTDGQTDDGRQVIIKAYLSFQLRWAKNQQWHRKTALQSLNTIANNVLYIEIEDNAYSL